MFNVTQKLCLVLLLLVTGLSHSVEAGADLKRASINVGKVEREYLIHTSDVAKEGARRLLLLLHGHGGSASQLVGQDGRAAPFKPWLKIAEENNAVLIAADGTVGADGRSGWNDLRGVAGNPTTDDLAFLRALIELAVAKHGASLDQVYIVGISNGGHMALRVALEAPELVVGIGVVVAAMPASYTGPVPSQPINVAFMNGTRDRFMPYGGGTMKKNRGEVLSTDDSLSFWVNANRCSEQATRHSYANDSKRDRSRVIRTQYQDCAQSSRVTLFKVQGAGHSTPSKSQRYKRGYRLLTGPQNWDIEAATEIWAAIGKTNS